ncbi:MAG: hypothetical protein NTY53_15235 [Kiritimatiellaeota bacterium]|nr:hypothetical protein [Kiritimatiellota bacterium]
MKRTQLAWSVLVLIGLTAGSTVGAAGTNAPAASTNAPAQPKDYRAMLQRVRIKQQERNGLEDVRKAVSTFQMRFGRLPAELTDLVERGVLSELPSPPPEMRFVYDRIKGNVSLVSRPNAIGVAPTNVLGRANVLLPR